MPIVALLLAAAGNIGYYRTPALSSDTLVFAAEGDLWRVPIEGGLAQRLTTHLGEETSPAISPDGKTLAFTASYEGPAEVYAMPLDGGAPTRLTYEGLYASVAGFTPDGKILYGTRRFAGTLDEELAVVDPKTGATTVVPLAQAHERKLRRRRPAVLPRASPSSRATRSATRVGARRPSGRGRKGTRRPRTSPRPSRARAGPRCGGKGASTSRAIATGR
jgi:dipeptidyl aminopeptidase/acylaminoacyl peptidase